VGHTCYMLRARMHQVQQNQPPGVPPLALTGERTLPDIPEENYWFRRHLAAYEWIAERIAGLRVADLACGEGYGAEALARTAAEVVGVDANPEAHAHARLRYGRPNLRFRRGLVQAFEERCDAIVFLQTIEHVQEPDPLLERFATISPLLYVTTPNRLTLAPPGAEKSDNPWHVREYTIEEYRALLEPHFATVEVLGVFHARKLRLHELALRAGWDRVHPALALTGPFYDRFIPAISTSDFKLTRGGRLERALDFLAICHA
jgi:SAM-dependent methyltransferase